MAFVLTEELKFKEAFKIHGFCYPSMTVSASDIFHISFTNYRGDNAFLLPHFCFFENQVAEAIECLKFLQIQADDAWEKFRFETEYPELGGEDND